ncbi:MAG TPA: hypothetical protein VLF94_06250 [Chlamydiales bacterium]|nr:hypothetical protein [Chlamydiales bacterium]
MEIEAILEPDPIDLSFREEPASEPIPEGEGHLLVVDLWAFGESWSEVQATYGTVENLYAAILDRLDAIRNLKEACRAQTEEICIPFRLDPIQSGISGSYFLLDGEERPLYVIKPIDEDAGCLNNPKWFRSPFEMSPIREHMPLYCAPFREVATYDIACLIGVDGVAPKTVLTILDSPSFYDFSESVAREELFSYEMQVGPPDKEKLCSAQEYVPNSQTLSAVVQELQAMELNDEEIAARFDQNDFEDANILIWTTYDTDAHRGNILCYPKGTDALGNEILGLKKIDNGLAFPEENQELRNALAYLPNATKPLSEEARTKIASIDVDAVAEKLKTHHLDTSIKALRERMESLKTLAQDRSLTIQEINRAMRYL